MVVVVVFYSFPLYRNPGALPPPSDDGACQSIRAVYFRNRWFRFADELLPVIVKFILNGSGVQIYF